MGMINKQLFNTMKNLIESQLENYPYFQIAVETPVSEIDAENLIKDKAIIEYRKSVVNAVKLVYERLDTESKFIIENAYFRNINSRDEVISQLKISKNKYYSNKNSALMKFGIAFGML